jgi:2-methylcitrate dehydratase PrpD
MKPEKIPGSHSGRLFDFAANAAKLVIPQSALGNARRCLLDALGCGLFGAAQPWSTILSTQLLAEKSQGAATVFGHHETLAPSAAALANGTAIHGFELDDLLPAAIIHPGTVIVPAALAAAESADATMEALLRGIVIGYEATSRISLALGTEPSQRGFHKTSVVGPVAAALAAGVVMRLNASQIACAAGLACSMSSGVKAYTAGGGGMVKRMHAGWAASSGVRAALLARDGFTAPVSALDGPHGLLDVFSGNSADAAQLAHALGEAWAIDGVWFKVYPLCGWIQGVVQLLLKLRGEIPAGAPLAAADINKVVVGTSRFAVDHNSNADPADTMDAQYSIPYCAALALTGDPTDPRAFEAAAYNDPALRALAKKVEICVDAECEAVYPRRFGSRVTLHLANGEVKQALTLDPHGTAADPCTDAELKEKFSRLAALAPLELDSAAILNAVYETRSGTTARQLGALLRS